MTTRRPDAPNSTMQDDEPPPASGLSSMQRAILTIQKMRTKIESLERSRVEPIAIVGMACRFPGGANSPEAFYKILEDGVDAIREVPPERWPLTQGGANGEAENPALRWGSFLDDVDRFDAGFFGVSPREAESLDPQQRLLLEVSWEAIERAGLLPERLMGSRTGVFIGVWALDYQQRVLALSEERFDAYCFTGNVLSTAAGRISYSFGLQGPCISVETACSSSLTAIHLACQSLRNGECNVALAGGVNLMLSPTTTKLVGKTQALSPDGRCKTFDARANGFVRGEGCGIIVLKRLSDAERDGDTILALIRGSAVNQDGRSTGLTAPNVLSQQALLKQALESARISPSDVGYVETHGTGTSLGDPIEVEALKTVLGGPREKGATCVLGAVKTNIGHLEAAAGVAGLIKVVLSLQNEKIPGNLHFRALNPRIDLRGTSLEIAQNAVPWKPGLRPRFAGVSGFGISGTNAHIVLEETPRNLEEPISKEASAYLLPISAKTAEALADHVRAYQQMLASPDSPRLLDIVYTASSRRSHFEHRLAAIGGSKEELARALDAYLRGEAPTNVVQGKAAPARAKVVFVFSGQGSQWVGMGKKLYDEESAFRSVIDSCDTLLMGRLGWSLLDELDAAEHVSRIGETQVAQPLIFAIQIALVELLRSWGVSPDAVIGHSVGEIAAAYIAGILSLDEAIRLVAIRGRIMQKATGLGKMISVAASVDVAKKAIENYASRLSIAAINDPGSVVIAGETIAIEEVQAKLEREGISCRPLRVNYAFHSPQMDPFAAELVERLARVDARRATLAMYSTVLHECVDGKELDVRYWGRNMREPVNLAGAVEAAIHDGYQLFLEVGPHPVLTSNVQQCLAVKKTDGLVTYSLRRNQDDRRALLETVGALYTRGCVIEWQRVAPMGGRCVALPAYPWQRRRYWVEIADKRAVPSKTLPEAGASVDSVDEFIYAVAWRKIDGRKFEARPNGIVLIFSDISGVAEAVARELAMQGRAFIRVMHGDRYERMSADSYCINPSMSAHYESLWRDVFGKGVSCSAILHLWGLDAVDWQDVTAETLEADQKLGVLSVSNIVRASVEHALRDMPRLFVVTRGAQSVGTEEKLSRISQAPLWGFGRTLCLEHPELRCTLVDLPPKRLESEISEFMNAVFGDLPEDRIAIRADGGYAARLVRSSLGAVPSRQLVFHSDAAYLITGGLGGLGLCVASWMVDRGARHIVLTGRSEPNGETLSVIHELERRGAHPLFIQGDVARVEDVQAIMSAIDAMDLPLRGVVHAAGRTGEQRSVVAIGESDYCAEQAAKLRGAIEIHLATKSKPLDFFVLYSSASALLGLVGHASYAAANAFLDALAEARVREGLPGMSIQWGAFGDVGLGTHDGRARRMAGAGMELLTSEEGTTLLGHLLMHPRPNVGVFKLNFRQWLDVFPQAATSKFFGDLQRKDTAQGKTDNASMQFKAILSNATPERLRVLLEQHLREQLGRVFRIEPSKIDAVVPFASLGADSLMSLEVKNNLERSLGLRLPATLLFTYATMAKLLAHLTTALNAESDSKVPHDEKAALSPAPQIAMDVGASESDDLLADFDATMRGVRGSGQ